VKPEDLFQFVVVGVVITMVLGMIVLLFCKDEHDDEDGRRKHERWKAERADRAEAKRERENEREEAAQAEKLEAKREREREKASEPPPPTA
jgi:hypothetical protein